MSDEPVTARAAALAERILEEVSGLDQDWGTIASRSRELALLADGAGAREAPPLAGLRELERTATLFRGLAHPTRLRILAALRESEPGSPAQLLHRLDDPPVPLGSISHHVRELAALGILAPAGTRPVRGALEHFYRLSSRGRRLLELFDRAVAWEGIGR